MITSNSDHDTSGRQICPGCGSATRLGKFDLTDTPVIFNYRFATAAAAANVKTGRVLLRQCVNCELVFNSTFDLEAMPYDENYENTQTCSAAFQEHLDSIADLLAEHCDLNQKNIIEIGCGKGDFLKMICNRNQAIGYGFDTSCEQEGWTRDHSICFYQRYLEPGEIKDPAGLIVCRHVVEHVQEIGEFMRMLHTISSECADAPVFIETPDWDWIAENRAHWDIFHEHCNYFSMTALANLAKIAGFTITRHQNVFGGQYQALIVKPNRGESLPLVHSQNLNFEQFTHQLWNDKIELANEIQSKYRGKRWAIWGAGAKGVCLANALRSCPPQFLIDVNPSKQSGFIPGTDITIISPHDQRMRSLEYVLVANPNYQAEIQQFADDHDLQFLLSNF